MKIIFFIAVILIGRFSIAQSLFDPAKTQVVLAGVLQWKDPKLATFSDVHRKDKELYDQFINMGIPESNITLLIDEEATLDKMNEAVETRMSACKEDETFIFYYAGHGVKEKTKYYFCNYDYSANAKFDVGFLNKTAAKKFNGKRIILLADCCYSGSLLTAGELISKKGKEVIVLSSATSSNISTGNWTFTQTLLDNFFGKAEGDLSKNGEISLMELAKEIKDAMKYRERQLNGYKAYGVDEEKTIVQKVAGGEKKKDKTQNNFTMDEYVVALTKGNWQAARIKALNADDITVEFYEYSDKREEIIHKKFVRKIQTPDYSSFTKVKVEWEKKWYPATIKKSEGDFYFIQYDGYDESWNEWIMYDRIETGTEKKAKAEWNTGWYDAVVLQEKNGNYFIHYKGYDHTWDEWVEKERVKF
jgi:translation initiation factor IF-1